MLQKYKCLHWKLPHNTKFLTSMAFGCEKLKHHAFERRPNHTLLLLTQVWWLSPNKFNWAVRLKWRVCACLPLNGSWVINTLELQSQHIVAVRCPGRFYIYVFTCSRCDGFSLYFEVKTWFQNRRMKHKKTERHRRILHSRQGPSTAIATFISANNQSSTSSSQKSGDEPDSPAASLSSSFTEEAHTRVNCYELIHSSKWNLPCCFCWCCC